jgi:hypothetical protein
MGPGQRLNNTDNYGRPLNWEKGFLNSFSSLGSRTLRKIESIKRFYYRLRCFANFSRAQSGIYEVRGFALRSQNIPYDRGRDSGETIIICPKLVALVIYRRGKMQGIGRF